MHLSSEAVRFLLTLSLSSYTDQCLLNENNALRVMAAANERASAACAVTNQR